MRWPKVLIAAFCLLDIAEHYYGYSRRTILERQRPTSIRRDYSREADSSYAYEYNINNNNNNDHHVQPQQQLIQQQLDSHQRSLPATRWKRRRNVVSTAISGATSTVAELLGKLPFIGGSGEGISREVVDRNDEGRIKQQLNNYHGGSSSAVLETSSSSVNQLSSSNDNSENDGFSGRGNLYRQREKQTSMQQPRQLNDNDDNKSIQTAAGNGNRSVLTGIYSPATAATAYHDYLSSIPIIGPLTHGIIDEIQSHVHLIKPGTKWCGDGNTARSYQDVGVLFKTDSCCRDHDKCSYYIPSHQTKHGLYNDGHWTRSHCDCDMAFYSCLKSVNSPFSTAVGLTYFNVLKMKCFKLDYPIVTCVRGHGWLSKSCTQYVVDRSQSKKWQWMNNYEF